MTSTPRIVGYSASQGIQTAATWQVFATYVVPNGKVYLPKLVRSSVTTAGSRSLIVAGQRLGRFDPGTNTFTDDGALSVPDFYDRLFYRVTTTHSANADTVTATYTSADGTTGRTTAGLSIPSSAPAGNLFEFVLAATGEGVIDLTNVTDTAAPTSVTDEIWGFRTLHEALGTTQGHDAGYLGENLHIPDNETVFILFNAAGTGAQQRLAQVVGGLADE